MENFQLYKKRDFSKYITDTITFFRLHWKNYFTNYAIIVGGLLVVLAMIYFFIFRDFFHTLSFAQVSNSPSDITSIFGENIGWFTTLMGVGLVLGFLFSLLAWLYPVSYLQLIAKNEKTQFSASELFARMKSQLKRVITFMFMSLITFVPMMIILIALSFILIVFIIGLPLLIILAPMFTLWFSDSFYVYLNENKSYFAALKTGWEITLSKFWHMWGATVAIYFLIQIVVSVITVFPVFVTTFAQLNSGNVDNLANIYKIIMPILYSVNFFLSYILMNFMMIAHGVMYYSYKEQTAHVQSYSEIQSIGQNAL